MWPWPHGPSASACGSRLGPPAPPAALASCILRRRHRRSLRCRQGLSIGLSAHMPPTAYQQLLAQVCLAEIVQIKRVLLLVDQPCAATVEKRTCGFPNSRWRLKSFQQSAATASRAKIYFVSARRLAAAVRAARHYSRLTLKDEALQEREHRHILEVLPMQHGVDGTCHSSFVITFCCLRFMTLKIRSALLHGLFLSDWRW